MNRVCLLPSLRRLCFHLCLSDVLFFICQLDYTRSTEQTCTKLGEGIRNGPGEEPSISGVDPVKVVAPIFLRSLFLELQDTAFFPVRVPLTGDLDYLHSNI